MPRAAATAGRTDPAARRDRGVSSLTVAPSARVGADDERDLDEVAVLLRREPPAIRLDRSQHSSLRPRSRAPRPAATPTGFLGRAADPVGDANDRPSHRRGDGQGDVVPARPPPARCDPVAAAPRRARAAGSRDVRVWSAAAPPAKSRTRSRCLPARRWRDESAGEHPRHRHLDGSARGRARRPLPRTRPSAVEPALRSRYFDADGDALVVGERLRRLVRFAPHNLARDPLPPLGEEPFDLILCRNVLIYFDGATVERAIDGLERALRPDGMLILGSADTLCGTVRRLEQIGAEESPVSRPKALAARALRRPLGRGAGRAARRRCPRRGSLVPQRRARTRSRRSGRRNGQPPPGALRRPGLRARGVHARARRFGSLQVLV